MNEKQPFEEDFNKFKVATTRENIQTSIVKRKEQSIFPGDRSELIARSQQGDNFLKQYLLDNKERATARAEQTYPGASGKIASYLAAKDDWNVSVVFDQGGANPASDSALQNANTTAKSVIFIVKRKPSTGN